MSQLPLHQIAEGVWVSPQLQPGDLAAVAAQGFRTVINNRPDGESPEQPLQLEIETAAKEAGLTYAYLPVVPGQFTQQQVAAFDKYLRELPGPVLAFCRSGNRCSLLFSAAMAYRQATQQQ